MSTKKFFKRPSNLKKILIKFLGAQFETLESLKH